jgi:tRNA (cmo5U34)-methyltransferase
MANPWLDDEKARAWAPGPRGGAGLRAEYTRLLLELAAIYEPRRILDVGSGTGDLDALALERFPAASLTCLDGSPGLLARARETLAPFGARASFVESDFDKDWREAVGAPFDVVMSVESIHHLESDAKRRVYAQCFEVLRPGGLFITKERVAFDGRLWPHVQALWQIREHDEGEEPRVITEGLDHAQWMAAERAGGDMPDTLDAQLGWLREIGFDPVETFARLGDRVVFGGVKPD